MRLFGHVRWGAWLYGALRGMLSHGGLSSLPRDRAEHREKEISFQISIQCGWRSGVSMSWVLFVTPNVVSQSQKQGKSAKLCNTIHDMFFSDPHVSYKFPFT